MHDIILAKQIIKETQKIARRNGIDKIKAVLLRGAVLGWLSFHNELTNPSPLWLTGLGIGFPSPHSAG